MEEPVSVEMAITRLQNHQPVSDAELDRRRDAERARLVANLRFERWLLVALTAVAIVFAIACATGRIPDVPSIAQYPGADARAQAYLLLLLGLALLAVLYGLVALAFQRPEARIEFRLDRWVIDHRLRRVYPPEEEQMIDAANNHREIAEVMLRWREQGVGLRAADHDAVLQARTALDLRAQHRRVGERWSELERARAAQGAPSANRA